MGIGKSEAWQLANQEHAERLLIYETAAWNEWREKNPEVVPHLDGVYFSGADIRGADLSRARLNSARLIRVDLTSANLIQAHLNSAKLTRANLYIARLIGAFLINAKLRRADLTGANLTGAKLYAADLTRSHLTSANLTGAHLNSADLTEADVTSVTYDRRAMRGCYGGIRGVDSCYGDAIFRRDAQDQDFIDTLESRGAKSDTDAFRQRCSKFWLRGWFGAWSLIDFGRGMLQVALWGLWWVLAFGFAYKYVPGAVSFGTHKVTEFTPFYFSFVTYTTLGFGDVSAGSLCGEILVSIEVVLGYITLGGLLAILANKVARRS